MYAGCRDSSTPTALRTFRVSWSCASISSMATIAAATSRMAKARRTGDSAIQLACAIRLPLAASLELEPHLDLHIPRVGGAARDAESGVSRQVPAAHQHTVRIVGQIDRHGRRLQVGDVHRRVAASDNDAVEG